MTNSRKSVVIIDDEELARGIIESYLKAESDFELIAQCSNGLEGFKVIQERKPDLIFLDVKMPKITGFEMLELIEDPPVVIFSTAFDDFAIEAFEKNAVDYLLKPYSGDRFKQALDKARIKLESVEHEQEKIKGFLKEQSQAESLQRVVVKSGSKINIVSVDDIRYIEAMDDYVRIHTKEGSYLKQNTMKFYETHLPVEEFVRIHRSYIVQVREISKLEPMGKESYVAQLKEGNQLSVSRTGYGKLKEVLNF